MEPLSLRDRLARAKRSPKRVCVTLSHTLHERVLAASLEQGRSLSNLCAHLIETAMEAKR
jgi:predicted HicB family RNase H-like nuclease